MNKKPDIENPEWTEARVARARKFGELPESLKAKLRYRGPQKTPTKVQTSVRYDSDVIEAFKAKGPGWQTRMNNALREWLREHA